MVVARSGRCPQPRRHRAPGLGVTVEQARAFAYADVAAGTTLIREVGSPLDTHPLDDDPRCRSSSGLAKHIARPKRYLRDYGVDLDDPDDLAAEVTPGGGRGRLGEDRRRLDRPETPVISPAVDSRATRRGGGRRARSQGRRSPHVFGYDALPDIIGAGFDCIEHGTGLTDDLIDEVVARDIALVPTMIQIENFPGIADGADRFPTYQATMRDLYARRTGDGGGAWRACRSSRGTDAGGFVGHGRIVDEVEALVAMGMPVSEALDAAAGAGWVGCSTTVTAPTC